MPHPFKLIFAQNAMVLPVPATSAPATPGKSGKKRKADADSAGALVLPSVAVRLSPSLSFHL